MNPLDSKAKQQQKTTIRLEFDLFIDTPLVLNKRELEERVYPKPLKIQEPVEQKPEKIKPPTEEGNKDNKGKEIAQIH